MNLRKGGARHEAPDVFSSPKRLAVLVSLINTSDDERGHIDTYNKAYVTLFDPNRKEVVYQISFSFERMYVGRTGSCLIDGLREHHTGLRSSSWRHLAVHCYRRKLHPRFQSG